MSIGIRSIVLYPAYSILFKTQSKLNLIFSNVKPEIVAGIFAFTPIIKTIAINIGIIIVFTFAIPSMFFKNVI